MASALLAVVLIASITEWALSFSARRGAPEPVKSLPTADLAIDPQRADTAAIARLFGASPEAAGGIRALGVMAEGASGRGIAVIAIDGKPARAVRAGETIAPGVVLAEVQRDGVLINRSGALQQIRIATKPPSQGILRAQ